MTYFNGQTGCPPFGKSFAQPARAASMGSQNLDRAIGVHTIGSSAVRDVFFFLWELAQTPLQIVYRHRERTRDVPGGVLIRRPGIQNDHLVRSRAFQKLVHFHEFSIGAIAEMLTDETFQVGELMFGDGSDRFGQVEDCRIRETVEHEQAIFTAIDQSRLAENLEMLRRVGEGQTQLGRK